jgi:hypothetical protein
MRVIGPSCSLPSKDSPGCGCAGPGGGKVAGAASITALAAVACTACCILPFTLPASLLAFAGGSIAVLDHAHRWATWLAVLMVGCAWLWIGWQVRRTKRTVARSTLAAMVFATLLTATAASWPLIEPVAFNAFGIVKQKATQQTG